MGAQDETMRLIAEVVDKATGPIKKMGEAFKGLGDEAEKAHKRGSKEAREHAKHMRELHERIEKTKEFMSDALVPALATVGITAFGVGEAVGTMAEKIRAAGEQYQRLNDTVQRGHVSSRFVQGMGMAFQRLGMDASRANGFISQTGETLDKLRRGNAAEMQRLQSQFGNTLPWLKQAVEGAQSYEEAATRIMKALTDERIPIDQRRKLAEAFHIDPRIASKNGEELGEALVKSMRDATEHGLDKNLLQKLDDAYTELSITQDKFWNDLIAVFGPHAIHAIEEVTNALEKLDKLIKPTEEFLSKNFHPSFENRNLPSEKPKGQKDLDWKQAFRDLFDSGPRGAGPGKTGHRYDNMAEKLAEGMSPISYRTSGSMNALSEGVKQGVLAAFREWAGESATPGGGTGFQNASYTTGGGAGVMRMHPNGSFGGGDEGRTIEGSNAHKGVAGITPKSMPAKRLPNSITSMGDHGLTGPVDVGADRVGGKFDRSRFEDELKRKPWLRDKILRIANNEQGRNPRGTQGVLESMMNRAVVRGTSLEAQAKWVGEGGYYAQGSMGRGALESPKIRSVLENSLNKVLHNSNITGYATDNSSQGLAEREASTGKFIRHLKINGESFFHPGTAEPALARRWKSMVGEELARQEHGNSGAHLADHIRHHVRDGIKSSMGGGAVKVQGDASLRVDLNGFPKGSRFQANASGMFKNVRLNRGRPMAMASQDA